MRCYRKILHISHKDHVTNEEVRAKIQQANGPHEDLLTIVKRRKLQWYCHVFRSSGLAKTILQGTVKGGRRQGRQRMRWEDIREWTGLEFGKSQRAVENRDQWRKLVAKSSVVPLRPSRLRDWWWWWCPVWFPVDVSRHRLTCAIACFWVFCSESTVLLLGYSHPHIEVNDCSFLYNLHCLHNSLYPISVVTQKRGFVEPDRCSHKHVFLFIFRTTQKLNSSWLVS